MGSLYNLMKPYSEFRSKEEFNTYQKTSFETLSISIK